MRRLLMLAALAAVLPAMTGLAAQAAASPAIGLWKLDKNNVVIRIAPCGAALCGRIVSADKLKDRPNLKDKMNPDEALRGRAVRNLLVLSGFTGGPEKWTGGKIYDPDKGDTYKSEMALTDPDTLELKGCILKPLCRTEVLTRVR